MRNVHVLTLSLAPKKETDKPGTVHIMRHHIVAMIPNEKTLSILMSNGVVYEVIETYAQIHAKCKNAGVMNEVM